LRLKKSNRQYRQCNITKKHKEDSLKKKRLTPTAQDGNYVWSFTEGKTPYANRATVCATPEA
jgi:hypothetical protein